MNKSGLLTGSNLSKVGWKIKEFHPALMPRPTSVTCFPMDNINGVGL